MRCASGGGSIRACVQCHAEGRCALKTCCTALLHCCRVALHAELLTVAWRLLQPQPCWRGGWPAVRLSSERA